MDKNELTDDAKVFVVQALACFDTPSEVAKAVREEFGATITRQSVEFYDPTKRAGATLSEGYKQLFEATRAKFLSDTAEIGVAHRSVRLRTLQRIATKAEGMGNLPLVATLLEQAAKEVGNAFTNKRELTGAEGKPLAVTNEITFADLDQDERDILRTLLARRAEEPEGSPSGA